MRRIRFTDFYIVNIILIGAKLLGYIQWDWLYVFAPLMMFSYLFVMTGILLLYERITNGRKT